EVGFADERVEVRDQPVEHVARPRIGRALVAAEDSVGDLAGIEFRHAVFLLGLAWALGFGPRARGPRLWPPGPCDYPGRAPMNARCSRSRIDARSSGRGFQYGLATARSAARSRPSAGMPIAASEWAAPTAPARSYSPAAASSAGSTSAAAIRA